MLGTDAVQKSPDHVSNCPAAWHKTYFGDRSVSSGYDLARKLPAFGDFRVPSRVTEVQGAWDPAHNASSSVPRNSAATEQLKIIRTCCDGCQALLVRCTTSSLLAALQTVRFVLLDTLRRPSPRRL